MNPNDFEHGNGVVNVTKNLYFTSVSNTKKSNFNFSNSNIYKSGLNYSSYNIHTVYKTQKLPYKKTQTRLEFFELIKIHYAHIQTRTSIGTVIHVPKNKTHKILLSNPKYQRLFFGSKCENCEFDVIL